MKKLIVLICLISTFNSFSQTSEKEDKDAIMIASAIDACNGNLKFLSPGELKKIDNIATKFSE